MVIVLADMDLSLVSMAVLAVAMCLVVGAVVAQHSRPLAIRMMGAIAVWLAVTAAGGLVGFFAAPRFLLMPLVTLGALFTLSRTPTARALFAATPMQVVIGLQVFRIAVELTLFALWKEGHAPQQMTFEGRNFDILVGLTAPLVAWLVARGKLSSAQIIAWNALGLAVLMNTIATAVTSLPGPLHLDWPGAPFSELITWPLIWLPAYLAPLAIALHVTSIRQAVARFAKEIPSPAPAGEGQGEGKS